MTTTCVSWATAAAISARYRLTASLFAAGQDERGSLALGRADRAEDPSRGPALISRRRRSCSSLHPAPGQQRLLTHAEFILPPQLYAGSSVHVAPDAQGSFFERGDGFGALTVTAWPGRELAVDRSASRLQGAASKEPTTALNPRPHRRLPAAGARRLQPPPVGPTATQPAGARTMLFPLFASRA